MFEPHEIEHLANLLVSPDAANADIALNIIEQSPQELVPALLVPLNILVQLQSSNNKEHGARVNDLFIKYVEEAILDELYSDLYVFALAASWWSQKPWTKVEEAIAYYQPKRSIYEPYLLSNPLLIKHYENLVRILWQQFQRGDLVLDFADVVLQLYPQNYPIGSIRYNALFNYFIKNKQRLDEIPKLQTWIETMLPLYPQHASMFYNLLGLLYDSYLFDTAKAKDYYTKSLQCTPKNDFTAGSCNNLANILYKKERRFEEAKALVQIALQHDSKNADYLDTLACIEWKGYQHYSVAEGLFRTAIQFNKEHHAATTGLGEVLEEQANHLYHTKQEQQDKYTEASFYYKEGLRLKPDSTYKHERLIFLLLYRLNQPEAAKEYLEKLLVLSPNNRFAKFIKPYL